jgi:hypothetical protein
MIKDVIIRKKQWGFRFGFRTRRLKGGDSARIARRETEADVRGQSGGVEFAAAPTDDRSSFAIRSGSSGNLVRE